MQLRKDTPRNQHWQIILYQQVNESHVAELTGYIP